MLRRAFTLKLKPGKLAEYKKRHDEIWPELVAEIERSGVAHITSFERDPDVFLFSEIADEGAWDRLWNTKIHKKWAEAFEPLMEIENGVPVAGELREIFHLETGAQDD